MAALRNLRNRLRPMSLFSSFARAKQPTAGLSATTPAFEPQSPISEGPKDKSESEWRAILSPEQFRILRLKGTERASSGEYEHHKDLGVYSCAGCGTPLYKSDTKFSSGCGWPAFFDGDHPTTALPPSCLLIPQYSDPRSRQSSRRKDFWSNPHRNHLHCVWRPPRPRVQG
jgi:hypothetical protein